MTAATVAGWITGASLAGVTFIDADLSHLTFAECNFERAPFGRTKTFGTTFSLCRLTPEQREGLLLIEVVDDEDG